MKKSSVLAGFLALVASAFAQTADFGDRAVELRGISADELAKPNIPEDAITNAPAGQAPFARPLYLVYRFYSAAPWLSNHVRSVFSSAPGFAVSNVVVDTRGDVGSLQVVNEANESSLGLNAGTAATHPAYGLYSLKVTACVPWDTWASNVTQRFYLRLHHRHPPICWAEHWWYYWRSTLYAFAVNLNSSQEVPPNSSPATGSGTLHLDPIYKTIGYDINYSGLGLGSSYSASHIHGPAGPGTNAGVLFPLVNFPANGTNTKAGRLFGSTTALTASQVTNLQNGLHYVNIHSTTFSSGEIRGQIARLSLPVFTAWRPTWIPLVRWGRAGPAWCLTITHPYAYPWDPYFRTRPVCVYGLRNYFTPVVDVHSPAPVPYIAALQSTMPPVGAWSLYPTRPTLKYWPYTPYCARWYFWQPNPFAAYRHLPPVVQFATFVNPDTSDPVIVSPFSDDPTPISGTTGVTILRALASQQGDLTGDGLMNLGDLSAFKQEQGTTSQDTTDTDGP